MKALLAPLLAITLAAMVRGSSENQMPMNANVANDDAVPLRPPVYVYGYWPGKRPSDPDTRTWDWWGDKVTVLYRDASGNDKSITELADEGYINIVKDPNTEGDFHKFNLPPEERIIYSVLFDKAGEPVCVVPGTTVPVHPRDCIAHMDAMNQLAIDSLDPNTPGIEDIHDMGAAMIHILPGALEAAKSDPFVVKMLDTMYDTSQNYEKGRQAMVERYEKAGEEQEAYEAEVDAELAAEGVQIEKRHNKS
ncbi:hypothetical protein BGZ82_002399 [Podila clonocystis]|nr:hypothetical protein BGZ82_002399 [Podila clonocystis]